MSEISLDDVREVIREVLFERDRRAEEERLAAERAELEHLALIRRKDLTAKQKSDLIDKLGRDGYLALPYGEPDQPRGADGRFKPR